MCIEQKETENYIVIILLSTQLNPFIYRYYHFLTNYYPSAVYKAATINVAWKFLTYRTSWNKKLCKFRHMVEFKVQRSKDIFPHSWYTGIRRMESSPYRSSISFRSLSYWDEANAYFFCFHCNLHAKTKSFKLKPLFIIFHWNLIKYYIFN